MASKTQIKTWTIRKNISAIKLVHSVNILRFNMIEVSLNLSSINIFEAVGVVSKPRGYVSMLHADSVQNLQDTFQTIP
jgi:hypothetical protein